MYWETRNVCDILYCDSYFVLWSGAESAVSLRCACMYIRPLLRWAQGKSNFPVKSY